MGKNTSQLVRRHFILPKELLKDGLLVSLPQPACDKEASFFVSPCTGFYEITVISSSSKQPRSWLTIEEKVEDDDRNVDVEDSNKQPSNYSIDRSDTPENDSEQSSRSQVVQAHASANAELNIATLIDPLFLMLPTLFPETRSEQPLLFRSVEDHLDVVEASSTQWHLLLRYQALKSLLEKRVRSVCNVVQAGDDDRFRPSEELLLAQLVEKARRMAVKLPPSMEKEFVSSVLHDPTAEPAAVDAHVTVLGVDVPDETALPAAKQDWCAGLVPDVVPATVDETFAVLEKQTPDCTTQSHADVLDLARLRTSLNLVMSYVRPALRARLEAKSTTVVDFTPLNARLTALELVRKETLTLRALSDNISRKRAADDDNDEAAERRLDKLRKKEADEKRRKSEGRGVRNLRKADTTGMSKLSSFFSKA